MCTNNISNDNKKIINELNWNNKDNLKHTCTCKIHNEYSLENRCNFDNIVYQANISIQENNNIYKAYIGMISLNWKFRYHNDLLSFRNPI